MKPWLHRAFQHREIFAPIAAVMLLTFGSIPAIAQTKIVHGTVFLSSTDWAGFVADAKGYMKEQGLEVETLPTRSSSKAIQQLAANALNVASSGMPDHLRITIGLPEDNGRLLQALRKVLGR